MADMRISDAEWQLMHVIWPAKEATAAEVIAALSKTTDWAHRTIRTLLARLVEKGVLAAQADGNRYLYRPLVSRGKCIRAESQSFLRKVFAGDAAELLAHFVNGADIAPDKIEELKRLMDEKRPSK